jgi:hypothetical protein
MAQIGNQRLGNAVVTASTAGVGLYPFPLRVIAKTALVDSLGINVTLTALPGASSTWVIQSPTLGIEGNDDVDRILNGVFNGFNLFIDQQVQSLAGLNPGFCRGPFAIMNRRDFQFTTGSLGTFTNGGAYTNAVAQTLQFGITIPISLKQMFVDGVAFRQGGLRFQSGELDFLFQQLTGANFTFTSKNGTAFTIASASVSVEVIARLAPIDFGGGLVGPLWELKRFSGVATVYDTRPLIRLGTWDAALSSGYTVNFYNLFEGPNPIAQSMSPANLAFEYQANAAGGDSLIPCDPTARITPLKNVSSETAATSIDQSTNPLRIDANTASSTLTLYDLVAHPPSEASMEEIGKMVNGGGPVAIQRPLLPSMGGKKPSPSHATLLPVAIIPPMYAGPGDPQGLPKDMATLVRMALNSTVASAKSTAQISRLGHGAQQKR